MSSGEAPAADEHDSSSNSLALTSLADASSPISGAHASC